MHVRGFVSGHQNASAGEKTVDGPLESFIARQIEELRRSPSPAPPDPGACLRVSRVASPSPAAHAGIGRGDLLVEIDGKPASSVTADPESHMASARAYRFHLPAKGEEVSLRTTGIALGATLRPTTQAIVARCRRRMAEPENLALLWEAGEFASLEALAADTLRRRRRPLVSLVRLVVRVPANDTPAYLLWGAALYELGRREEAARVFDEYDELYAGNWTTNYMAVSAYYRARQALDSGNRDLALERLEQAHAQHDFDRIADLAEQLSGVRPERPSVWRGRPFPLRYELPILGDGARRASLEAALASMGAGQILLVCLLATYRGNGPYNVFVARYRHAAVHLREHLHGLHVITMRPDRSARSPHYYAEEDRAVADGLPLVVLHDIDGAVTEVVDPEGSPWIFALDRTGAIVHDEIDDATDLWDALGRAS